MEMDKNDMIASIRTLTTISYPWRHCPPGTNLEVVVRSKLCFSPPTLCDATHLTTFHLTASCSLVATCM